MAQRKITGATGKASCLLAPAIVALTILGLSTAAEAAGTEVNREENNACKVTVSNPAPACGAIVYANAGAYIVNPVKLKSKAEQPSGVALNPACGGSDYQIAKDVLDGQYETFIQPADCAYKLKINIVAGTQKDRNLFLTPGCQIIAKTDGTTLNNKWHVSVQWTDKAKKQAKEDGVTLPDKPIDQQGNKCGRLGKM